MLTPTEHAAALKRMREYPPGVHPIKWGTGPIGTDPKAHTFDALREHG